jgi:multidrug efflux pump subunit AcrA (membrane-fusion protein)
MKFVLIKILFLLTGLLFLSACADSRSATSDDALLLEQAIAEGYLLHYNPDVRGETQTEAVAVERRTLIETHVRTLAPVFLTHRHLYFDTPNRVLAAIHVVRGQRVQVGDILAELEPLDPEEAERLFLRRRNTQIALERFERDFALENNRRLVELMQAQEALDLANDDEWVNMALNLSRREISYRQYLLNAEQNRERLTRQLETINEQIAGDQIIAPVNGVVVELVTMQSGTRITGRPRMMTLAAEDSLFFAYVLPAADTILSTEELRAIYRFGDILAATMLTTDDRISFDVKIINDPWVTGNRASIRYLFAPLDWDAFYQMLDDHEVSLVGFGRPSFGVEVDMLAVDVLSVPSMAIQMFNEREFVYIYENGSRRRKYVELGARCNQNQSRFREVLNGLEEGQYVVIFR